VWKHIRSAGALISCLDVVYARVCVRVHRLMCVFVYVRTCIRVHACISMYVLMCVCMCMCVFV